MLDTVKQLMASSTLADRIIAIQTAISVCGLQEGTAAHMFRDQLATDILQATFIQVRNSNLFIARNGLVTIINYIDMKIDTIISMSIKIDELNTHAVIHSTDDINDFLDTAMHNAVRLSGVRSW